MKSPNKDTCIKRLLKEAVVLQTIVRREFITPESAAIMTHMTSLIALLKISYVIHYDLNISTKGFGLKDELSKSVKRSPRRKTSVSSRRGK